MRVLVVGAGRWGSLLIERFVSLVGRESVFVYDEDREKIGQANLRWGARDWGNWDKSFVPDAVVLATPPGTHYRLAASWLRSGVPTLVEKPLALTGEHARELVLLAASRSVLLMTDDTFLYMPRVQGILSSCDGKNVSAFGALWSNPRETSPEGILWTLGPHPVSLMIQVMGEYPTKIRGSVTPRVVEVRYTYPQGEASIRLSWDNELRYREISVAYKSNPFHMLFYNLDEGVKKGEAEDPLSIMCQTFLGRVADRANPWIDLRARRVVEILEATERTCASRSWVEG